MPTSDLARFSLAKAYSLFVLLGLGLVLAAGAIAYRSTRDYGVEKARVVHTYTVLASLDRLNLALLEAHRAKRGFVITGDDDFLDTYNASLTAIESVQGEIWDLTADDSEQQGVLKALRPLLTDLVARFNSHIASRRASAFDPGRELAAAHEAEGAIQQCRDLIETMRHREEQLLSSRSARAEKRAAVMLNAMASAIIASVLFLALAAWRSRAELRHRVRSEMALQEKQERLSLAVSGGGLGTWDLDYVSGRLSFNRRWAEMLGYGAEELEQNRSTWERLVHPDDFPRMNEALEQHLRGQSPDYRVEARFLGKGGNWVWVQATGRVISRDDSGAPLRICGTHLDVTDARTRAEALQAFAEELERSNKELDDFAYIASHDLKEPLRGIRNYADFLLEDYGGQLDEEGVARLHTLTKLSGRLETFIDDLLRYSRVGREKFAMQPCDTGQMAADVATLLGPWLEQEGARIEIVPPMPVVACHPVYTAEVFKNLIGNGVKYNDKSEKLIQVGCLERENAAPAFYVRDNGIGIPERHQESIFQIFKRLHGRDKYGGGSGAGLTIARKIVEGHGGRIWIESTVGQGSTFYFTLSSGESPL